MRLKRCPFGWHVGLAILVAFFELQMPAAESGRLLPGDLHERAPEPGTLTQTEQSAADFRIVVIAGEDAINIVKKKTAVAPIVEVRDKNNKPVSGAVVTFTTPTHGASGVFLDGTHSTTVVTNAEGRAAVTNLQPVGTGRFQIAVSAAVNGEIATATIAQTNVSTAAAAATASGASAGGGGGLSRGVIFGILAGVATAVGVGLAVGFSKNSGAGSSSTAISGTIGAGTPTVGAPH